MLDVDARLAQLAADQLGIVHRDECLRIGLHPRGVDRRVQAGLLHPLFPGVYRHSAAPPTFEGHLLAAVRAAGPLVAASGPSAMRLYDVRGAWIERPEITVVGTRHVDLPGVTVRRIDRLRPGDIHHRFGIPVLAPPLALLLLGASEPKERVVTAVHDMVFVGHTIRPRLFDVLDVYGGRGRRGTASYREGIASLDPNGKATQTNLELDILRLFRLQGLPEPVLQHRVDVPGGPTYRLDFAYLDELVDVEGDGDRWHLSEPDRRRDRVRDAALAALGWAVHRFGSADIHLRPSATVAIIRRSLAERRRPASSDRQRTG